MPADVMNRALGVARRQWWIVLLAVVSAGVVGYALLADTATTWIASATISVDASTLSRVSGLPGPERTLKAVRDRSFTDELAKRAGVDASVAAAGFRAFTVGSPVESFVVEYRGDDEADTTRIATEASDLAVETIRALGAIEFERQDVGIAEAESLVATLEAAEGASDAERADIAFMLWEARVALADAKALRASCDQAYSLRGDVSTSFESAADRRLEAALGAAVVGLAVGVGVALVRERLTTQDAGA